jgi:hypothetical protein
VKPLLINRRTSAACAAARWSDQYREGDSPEKLAIGEKLQLLGPAPYPDAVDAIIGNDSWTRVPRCSACGSEKEFVIRVGEAPNYESETACLCDSCLEEAYSLL